MFGCIYQLWDWLDAPPLFNGTTMDAKKLQQLQAVNAKKQKKVPLAYQANIADYRTATHSPIFLQQSNANYHNQALYHQSPTATSSSGGGTLSPIDIQPQVNKLLLKHHGGGGTTSSSSYSSPYHQANYQSGEQIYQSPTERTYLTASGRLQNISGHNPVSALQQQYQQLQQAKLQAQLHTQNEAVQIQQRTFAMRQALNPPVPQGQYHLSQSSSILSNITLQQQQRAPPSSLNLSNQFHPAIGPLKLQQQQRQQQQLKTAANQQQQEQLYAQQQQQLQMQLQHQQQLQQQNLLQQQRQKSDQQTPSSEHGPVYIQQNHPGHVVNQACQTQISTVKEGNNVSVQSNSKTTPSSEESSTKSPTSAPFDRKKSVGSMQALKSPISKRPPSTPVTLSGWLYKQGSDGLKVWRKRWFVLSEYCLYYYKGPEEEKLLGSVLLPSYKVSACLPEDKIYRKFAFKCEHHNMRTYWLSAETGESMLQWVRALTAASMMQAPSSGESDQTSQPSMSSSLNHSGENSDSGIHTLQSHQSKISQGQVTPASEKTGNNGNSASSSNSGRAGLNGAQPLYANAPPKPRRINDGGYSSPSPEQSIENEFKNQIHSSRRNEILSPTIQKPIYPHQQQPPQHHAIYDTRTGSVSSAFRLHNIQQQYSADNLESKLEEHLALGNGNDGFMKVEQQQCDRDNYNGRELYTQKLGQNRFPAHLSINPNLERRTPDAYGRANNRIFADYEDIYNLTHGGIISAQDKLINEAASYRRPLSPSNYDASKHVPVMTVHYAFNNSESKVEAAATSQKNKLDIRPETLVRPHSADFIEYESRDETFASENGSMGTFNPVNKSNNGRVPRPKSSLDINRMPDSFYYSEASYAEKMRKSALYLQNSNAQPQQAGNYRTVSGFSEFQNQHGSGINIVEHYENPYERSHKRQDLLSEAVCRQQGAASIPRMSRATVQMSGVNKRSVSVHPAISQGKSPLQEVDLPPLQHQAGSIFPPTMSTQEIIKQSEQFLRSASARLPKRSNTFDEDLISSNIGIESNEPSSATSPSSVGTSAQDGERKREESMKRLLEWKQRMLQSPLTRKSIQQASQPGGSSISAMSKLGSNPNILLSSTAVASGAHYAVQTDKTNVTVASNKSATMNTGRGLQRSQTETYTNSGANAGYNSYSSDDEALKEMPKASTGRSTKKNRTAVSIKPTAIIYKSCSQIPDATTTTNIAKVATLVETKERAITNTLNIANVETNKSSEPNAKKKTLTLNVLKPIYKVHEASKTPIIQVQPRSKNLVEINTDDDKPRLNNVTAHNKFTSEILLLPNVGGDLHEELSIVPMNLTLKSPHGSTKMLQSSITNVEVKTYENIEFNSSSEVEKMKNEMTAGKSSDAEPTVLLTQLLNESQEENDQLSVLKTEDSNIFKKINEVNTCNNEEGDDNSEDDTYEEYTDDDLDEALAATGDIVDVEKKEYVSKTLCNITACSLINENESDTQTNEDLVESHYLPMTPKKIELGQQGPLSLVALNFGEENHYVEMTKGLNDEDGKNNYESMCTNSTICTTMEQKRILSLTKAISVEPVYMELSGGELSTKMTTTTSSSILNSTQTAEDDHSSSGKSTLKKNKNTELIKKKSKKSAIDRTQCKLIDMPDILKPTHHSILSVLSDSSDADDESSKKIDSKKLRSRTRFSLSDTFRPASYYLGTSTPLSNNAESSDSEIVPPPPIPVSAPVEELKTEEFFSAENYDTVKRRNSSSGNKMDISYEQLIKIHASNASLDVPKRELPLKSSRLSLPDQFSKLRSSVMLSNIVIAPTLLNHHDRTLSDSNYSFQTDNSSNTSSDFELYNKLKQQSPSFIASPMNSQYNIFTPGDNSETDFAVEYRNRSDSELERQRSRRPLSEESISEIESFSEKFEETLTSRELDCYLSQLLTNDMLPNQQQFNRHIFNEQNKSSGTVSLTNLIKPPKIFRNSDDNEEGNFYGNIQFLSSTDSIQQLDEIDTGHVQLGAACMAHTKDIIPIHRRNNSNVSTQSAPYYYSELSSSRELIAPLNNQRDIHPHGINIAHIHNPIERHQFDMEILADKDQAIDSKNLYTVKPNNEKLNYSTAKNLKASKAAIPSTNEQKHKLGNCNAKLSNVDSSSYNNTHNHNNNGVTSEEFITKNINVQKAKSIQLVGGGEDDKMSQSHSTIRTSNSTKISVLGGELLWEEDTLWRESLRRVSLRHARSLDDLDRIVSGTGLSIKQSTKPTAVYKNKKKLSRDVIYVNDNVSQEAPDDYKPVLKEAQANQRVSLINSLDKNDNDVYVQLMQEAISRPGNASHDIYEALREDTASNISHKSSEFDRETIRQWDSMSSGLMKNNNVEHCTAFSTTQPSTSSSPTSTIIQHINLNSDSNSNSILSETIGICKTTSISVQNVRNLPKGNLTVKPEPSDPQQHQLQLQQLQEQVEQEQQAMSNYIDIKKLTNQSFGSEHEEKYSKTLMEDRGTHGGIDIGFISGGTGDISMLATSTPMHSGNNGDNCNSVLYDLQHDGYPPQNYSIRRGDSRVDINMLERETSTQMRNLEVSAGDLLSRTHEELVLLLIQLRRQNSNTARAIEQYCSDIHNVQNRIRTSEGLTRAQSIQRLDYLKQHLLDLERQYEKSKPLVNLVDNMVKLGSLYRNNDVNRRQQQCCETSNIERLGFNQKQQERQLLFEEQKQWDRLNPNHTELQAKVHQLYQLDQLLQEESGTLQNLQRNKEELESALGGLRLRLQDSNVSSGALDAAKKQQQILERELSRVHQLLADNSMKLEETVAGNIRLEQELLLLRQKVQASRASDRNDDAFENEDSNFAKNTTIMLESELRRVQSLVGDIQRQRHDLSSAVRQLTENSHRLYHEIDNKEGSAKKRTSTTSWIETDLDSMISMNCTLSDSTLNLATPLYVDTGLVNLTGTLLPNSSNNYNIDKNVTQNASLYVEDNIYSFNRSSDNAEAEAGGIDSDGFLETNPFSNVASIEKQEIKTVRIVKRESERRQRDRANERVGSFSNLTQNIDQGLEEEQHLTAAKNYLHTHDVRNECSDDYKVNSRSKSLPRTYNESLQNHRYYYKHQDYFTEKQNGRHDLSTMPTSKSKYRDYSGNSYDRNSSAEHNQQFQHYGTSTPREHLNPLANAYFAKQLQQSNCARDSSRTVLRQKTDSVQSLNKSLSDLCPNPLFQSEAARQIINEMSAGSASEDTEKIVEKIPPQQKHRRAVPREKRRHYTAPNNVNVKAMEKVQAENDMNRNNTNWRARDDLDMEVALRPRINAPDVVRSALGGQVEKISENTIDNLLLAPNKIVIPERYIPETTPELSPEEKKRRQEKVESIKKMLSEAPISTANENENLPPSKINAEKKQREHLLQLNQILAQQVMQMSKIVAEKAMSKTQKLTDSDDAEGTTESPSDSLPLCQQRDNFFN